MNLTVLVPQIISEITPAYPDWTISALDENYANALHSTGAQLIFRLRGQRISINGGWLHNGESCWRFVKTSERNHVNDNLTISATRKPQAIANVLMSRLLPTYLPAYQKAVELATQSIDSDEKALKLAIKLAAIVKTKPYDHNPNAFRKTFYSLSNKEISVTGVTSTYQGGSVNLRLDYLEPEQAEYILKYLTQDYWKVN